MYRVIVAARTWVDREATIPPSSRVRPAMSRLATAGGQKIVEAGETVRNGRRVASADGLVQDVADRLTEKTWPIDTD